MEELETFILKYDFPPELIIGFDETMLDGSGDKCKVILHSTDPKPFTKNKTKLHTCC